MSDFLVTQPVQLGEVLFLVRNVPARRHPERPDEHVLDADVYRRVHQLVMREYVRRGLMSGEAFKALRKMARLKAAEVADLFGVSPTSVSHWETGRHGIPKPAWALMVQLALHEDVLPVLEAVRAPQLPAPEGVELDLAA